MAAHKLHVGISLVYPRAHVGHVNGVGDFVYLVLEPMLLGSDNAAIKDYFTPEHSLDNAGNGSAAEGVFNDFDVEWLPAGESADPCPVPLPPGAKITFACEPDTPTIQDRTVGAGGPPYGAKLELWPEIMQANGLTFRKFECGEDLWIDPADPAGGRVVTGDEFAALIDWGMARLHDILPLQTTPDPASQPYLHALYDALKPHYEAAKADGTAAPASRDWWIEFLTKSYAGLGKAAIVWMLDKARALAHDSEVERKRLSYPTFDYAVDEVRARLRDFFPAERDTYAELFWAQYRGKLAHWNLDAPEEVERFEQNVSELKRLLFLGERLFWTVPTGGTVESDIMLLPGGAPAAATSIDITGWRWTNNLSLFGHCFGIPRADLPALRIREISIGGKGVAGFDASSQDRLEADLARFAEEADIAKRGDKLHLSVDMPAAAAGSIGRIRFRPRLTTLDPDPTVPTGYGGRLLTVPTPILDALEGRAEWDMPLVDPTAPEEDRYAARFVRQTRQRAMVALTDNDFATGSPDRSDLIPAAAQQALFHRDGLVRLRAKIRRVRATGLPGMKVNGQENVQHVLRFELDRDVTGDDVPDSLHVGDLKEMRKWAGSPAGAYVWYGPGDRQEEALLDPILSISPEPANLAFTVSATVGQAGVFDGLLGAFLVAEAAALADRHDPDTKVFEDDRGFTFPVELLFGVNVPGTERFNAILLQRASDAPHYIALGKAFDFNFLNGSEHTYRRFYLRQLYDKTLDKPWEAAPSPEPERSRISETFSGAVKAFVYLKAETAMFPGHNGVERLTVRDHLLPRAESLLPTGEAQVLAIETGNQSPLVEAEGAGRGYELLHSFTNVMAERSSLTWDERIASENPRFQFHALAGVDWRMQVRADSRFGHPHVGLSLDSRRLPLFSPIAHPASRLAQSETEGEQPTPMLSFDFDQASTTAPERVRLRFKSRYFREVLKGRARPNAFTDNGTASRDPDISGLRDIYETFLDLYTGAVHADERPYNTVTLRLELWNFDNRKRGALKAVEMSGIRTDTEFPSLVGSLAYQGSLDLALEPPADAAVDDPRRRLRDWLARLLFGDGDLAFDRFCERLTDAFAAPSAPDKVFDFLLLGGPAVWRDPATGEAYAGAPGAISKTTNVVRAGLDIERHASRVPDAGLVVREGDVHPTLLDPEKARSTGLPTAAHGVPPWMVRNPDGTTPDPAPHKTEIVAVKQTALTRLNEMLHGTPGTPSELRRHFDWLRVEPAAVPPEKDDPQFPRRLLGPAFPYAKLPAGLRSSASDKKLKLYSVPVAFVQFPAIDPFPDRVSSNEFVQFLFDILQSFCDGVAPRHLPLESHDVQNGEEGAEALLMIKDQAIAWRRRLAEHLVRPEILAFVEDDEIVLEAGYQGELRHWDGYRDSAGNTTDDVAAQNALLDKVRTLRGEIFDTASSPARSAIAEMLGQDLRLYSRAKAIAVHLLDETETVNDRMYSCILTKYIRQQLWIGADEVLQPTPLRDVLRAATPGTNLRKLGDFLCGDSGTSQELVRLLALSDDGALRQGFARLFTFVIDNRDLQEDIAGLDLPERSLDHWRLDRLLKPGSLSDTSTATLRHRLLTRRNRLILDTILREALDSPAFVPADKRDTDRFTFLGIRGDAGRRFLIDVLEDEDYDSEYEVAHHLTMARSADDVLENANDYGWLRNTDGKSGARDDFGVDPGERNLEIRLEPHNPEWREWQHPRAFGATGFNEAAPKRPVRWYYVLPSRLPPAQPLPLEMADDIAGSGATSRLSNDLATRIDWHNRPQHIFPVAAANLNDLIVAYDDNYRRWADLGGENPVYLRDALKSGAPLALTVEDRQSSTRQLYADAGTGALARAVRGWQEIESFVAHYHFEVQPDEEAASGSLLDGFRNDNFRIEIEEYDIGLSPRQVASTKAGELGQREKLVGWYQYHRSQDRMAEQPYNREVVPPPMMTAAAAFTDLVSHLDKVIDKVPAFPQLADDPANAGVKRRVVRIALVGTQSYFSILPTQMTANAAKEPHYGTLLDARLLSFPREETNTGSRTVLRLSVLCSAVFNYRLRVKVRRNFRDVDHDGDTDMNPRFQMASEASPWVALGHYTVLRSPAVPSSLPTALHRLQAAPNSATRKQWFEYPIDQPQTPGEFGDPLRHTFERTNGYWGHLREAPLGEDLHKHLVVSAVHLSARPDRTQSLSPWRQPGHRDPARDSYRPQAFAVADTAHLDTLFNVTKKDAPSVAKALSFVWYYTLKEPTPGADPGAKMPILVLRDLPYAWPRDT